MLDILGDSRGCSERLPTPPGALQTQKCHLYDTFLFHILELLSIILRCVLHTLDFRSVIVRCVLDIFDIISISLRCVFHIVEFRSLISRCVWWHIGIEKCRFTLRVSCIGLLIGILAFRSLIAQWFQMWIAIRHAYNEIVVQWSLHAVSLQIQRSLITNVKIVVQWDCNTTILQSHCRMCMHLLEFRSLIVRCVCNFTLRVSCIGLQKCHFTM